MRRLKLSLVILTVISCFTGCVRIAELRLGQKRTDEIRKEELERYLNDNDRVQ